MSWKLVSVLSPCLFCAKVIQQFPSVWLQTFTCDCRDSCKLRITLSIMSLWWLSLTHIVSFCILDLLYMWILLRSGVLTILWWTLTSYTWVFFFGIFGYVDYVVTVVGLLTSWYLTIRRWQSSSVDEVVKRNIVLDGRNGIQSKPCSEIPMPMSISLYLNLTSLMKNWIIGSTADAVAG